LGFGRRNPAPRPVPTTHAPIVRCHRPGGRDSIEAVRSVFNLRNEERRLSHRNIASHRQFRFAIAAQSCAANAAHSPHRIMIASGLAYSHTPYSYLLEIRFEICDYEIFANTCEYCEYFVSTPVPHSYSIVPHSYLKFAHLKRPLPIRFKICEYEIFANKRILRTTNPGSHRIAMPSHRNLFHL
jgi:hypothetical protein